MIYLSIKKGAFLAPFLLVVETIYLPVTMLRLFLMKYSNSSR